MRDNAWSDKRQLAVYFSIKYLYWVTFFMIVVSSVIHYYNGFYGGDLEGAGYVVQLSSLFFFTSSYVICLVISKYLSIYLANHNLTGYAFHCNKRVVAYPVFLFFSLLVLFVAVVGGVGTIHREVETNRFAELFFALFDPYTFMVFIIYFVYLHYAHLTMGKILLFFVVIIYLFLIVRSGFTGFLIFLLPVFFLILLRFFSVWISVLVMILSVLLFPFIRIGKWIVGSGLSWADIDFDLFLAAARGVVERFSAVPNMVFINDYLPNKEVFLESSYLPFFQGYLGSFFHKLFYSEPVSLNTLLLHQAIQNTDSDSNSTFPILSYLSLDFYLGFFSLLYILMLVFFLSALVNLILGFGRLGKHLVWFFVFYITFFYAFNGWLWALWGAIQSALLFILMMLLIGKLKKNYM